MPDFRLIDYLVFLLSTNTSPSLSGALGNSERLKRDLASLGVFDSRMSLYLLIKLREQAVKDVAAHIQRSWEPRMRTSLLQHVAQNGDAELSPIVREALPLVKIAG